MKEVCPVIHPEKIKKVQEEMLEDQVLYEIAELFKTFADSTRIKILCALLHEELCVCDIATIVKTTQSAISHQLRILKHLKLITPRKDGKVVYYRLTDDHVKQIIEIGRVHLEEI